MFTSLRRNLVQLPAVVLSTGQDVFALALRVWVSWQFLASGWLKVSAWENTLFLFQEEYRVPLLPPEAAAVAGTVGELVFPVFVMLGLAGRLSALGLSVVNALAVVSYAHVLLSDGFEAALRQHELWALALGVIVLYGPGRLSLDYLFARGNVRVQSERSALVSI
jgi:putative oxidoreductase